VRTNARATRVTVDAHGRANGVDYLLGREQHHQPAKFVILSSYLYENLRLMLLSKSKAYPRGLSNNHGRVGVGFFPQAFHYAYGLFDHRLNRFGPSGEHTAIDDFDADNFDHTGLGFIGGGSIHASMEAKPISSARQTPPSVPKWGSEWKRWAAKHALSTGPLYTQMDTLPYEDQSVDLDPTHKDPQGFPLARVTWTMKPEALRRAGFLATKQERLLREMGAINVWRSPQYVPVNQHAYGGARMGSDPDQFVLDRWGLSHEVPNLAVLGGAGALPAGAATPPRPSKPWRGEPPSTSPGTGPGSPAHEPAVRAAAPRPALLAAPAGSDRRHRRDRRNRRPLEFGRPGQ
jgi:gluconate 2-dehydrogenase alpha chain